MALTPTRRAFVTGSAGATACMALGTSVAGQTAPASDGFRILRAKPGIAGLRGQGPGQGQPETPIWGYDGSVPGPPLRIRQDEELKIRLENELPEATAIHWHGCRLPNAMDGVPYFTQPKVEAGARFDYRFKTLDAGTFWYHAPCTLPGQLERGLYGVLIVEEKVAVEVDRDIVLALDDWMLRAVDIATRTNERLRLRLVNAAKARVMRLRFDRHAVRVMAIDGQPAQQFLARDSRVTLGPGNRIDLFLDAVLEPGEAASIFLDQSGTEKEIARIVYERSEKRRAAPLPEPPPLPANPLPERIDMRNALRAEAPFDENATAKTWTIVTGTAPDRFGPPLFSVKRGRAVVMAFPNRDNFGHAIHLHGHHVRLLDNLDDGWKPFWLDTVMVGARQTARIAFVADNPGKWMIYAQRLEHPEIGMTAWFEVS